MLLSIISINSNAIVYNDSSASSAAVCSSASLALIFGLGSGNKQIVIFLNISSHLHFQELRFQGLFLILERQPLLCIKFRAVGQSVSLGFWVFKRLLLTKHIRLVHRNEGSWSGISIMKVGEIRLVV